MIGKIPKKYAVKKSDNVRSMNLIDAYFKAINGRRITFSSEAPQDEEVLVFETQEERRGNVLVQRPTKLYDADFKN
jgi:hypothetical protein